jgi:hypothetical protein
MPSVSYLKGEVFEPEHIRSMSWALEEVCNALGVCDARSREVIATRVIELARHGRSNGIKLRDRVLQEANAFHAEAPSVQWQHQMHM